MKFNILVFVVPRQPVSSIDKAELNLIIYIGFNYLVFLFQFCFCCMKSASFILEVNQIEKKTF